MTALTTLQEVKQSFDNWRSKRGKLGPFPEELWKSAIKLLGQNTESNILRELRITKQQLDDQKVKYGTLEDQNNTFVSCDVKTSTSTPLVLNKPTTRREVRRSDGTTLSIIDFPSQDISTLLSTFIG